MKAKFSKINRAGFLNVHLLIGLFIVMIGISLALLGSDASSMLTSSPAKPQQNYNPVISSIDLSMLPPGFDCSKIHELGFDKQANLWAGMIMIACGQAHGGSSSPSRTISRFIQNLLPAPLVYGTADVDIVTGPETYAHITQSETFTATNPDNPNQIVVAYNDTRGFIATPVQIAGASVSTDGGNTFTRLTLANCQSPFNLAGINGGDPLLCTTARPRPGIPSGSTEAVATVAWASADTNPPRPGTRIAGAITAFTTARTTIETLAGPTTIHRLPFMGGCTSPGTTSTAPAALAAASSYATLLTTV